MKFKFHCIGFKVFGPAVDCNLNTIQAYNVCFNRMSYDPIVDEQTNGLFYSGRPHRVCFTSNHLEYNTVKFALRGHTSYKTPLVRNMD